jgi:hypothetical protein
VLDSKKLKRKQLKEQRQKEIFEDFANLYRRFFGGDGELISVNKGVVQNKTYWRQTLKLRNGRIKFQLTYLGRVLDVISKYIKNRIT